MKKKIEKFKAPKANATTLLRKKENNYFRMPFRFEQRNKYNTKYIIPLFVLTTFLSIITLKLFFMPGTDSADKIVFYYIYAYSAIPLFIMVLIFTIAAMCHNNRVISCLLLLFIVFLSILLLLSYWHVELFTTVSLSNREVKGPFQPFAYDLYLQEKAKVDVEKARIRALAIEKINNSNALAREISLDKYRLKDYQMILWAIAVIIIACWFCLLTISTFGLGLWWVAWIVYKISQKIYSQDIKPFWPLTIPMEWNEEVALHRFKKRLNHLIILKEKTINNKFQYKKRFIKKKKKN